MTLFIKIPILYNSIMRHLKLVFIVFLLAGCISLSKTPMPERVLFFETKKAEKTPFSKILVQWKNYPYSDYHKVNNLEKEPSELKAVEVEQKDYLKFKKMIINSAKEIGLYDEFKGTGTIKILLLSYGRWSYKELLTTYLTDTPYIFILPSSLGVRYRMIAYIERGNTEYRIENEGLVKTTFFLPLFPLYPLMRFNGAEKTTLQNLIDKTLIDIARKI